MYRYELESWKVLGWCEEVPAPLWKLCCSLPVKNAWMKNHHQLRHTSSVTSENSEWGYAQKTWLPNLQCQKCTIFHLMSDSSQQSDLKTCYYRVKRTSHHLRKSNSTIGEGNGTPLQYCCLENPMDGGAWKAEVHGVAEGRTWLNDFTFTHWRRKWQPTPVFLPGESGGWESLVGCRLWGHTESDTTEVT